MKSECCEEVEQSWGYGDVEVRWLWGLCKLSLEHRIKFLYGKYLVTHSITTYYWFNYLFIFFCARPSIELRTVCLQSSVLPLSHTTPTENWKQMKLQKTNRTSRKGELQTGNCYYYKLEKKMELQNGKNLSLRYRMRRCNLITQRIL